MVKELPNPSKAQYSILFWFSLMVVGLAAVALRAVLLDSFPLSPDEGIHLIWLRLLEAGYRPYTEVYITYPPLYPMVIEAVWNIWPTDSAQRWFSTAYTLFGAVGIALVARKFAGPIAGVAAATLTLFSPPLVEPSRAVLGEFPSVAWSVWAIWLAWLYRDAERRRRILLVLSGLCLAASLLTKLLSPFIAVLIFLIVVSRWYGLESDRVKPFLIDLGLWGLALIGPAVILISVYDVGPLFRQVVEQRVEAREAYTADENFWPPRYERGATFAREDTALVVLALIGLGLAWLRRKKELWIMLAWLALALGMLALHNPIRYKHFLILIPPFAILGGVAIAFWIDHVQRWLLGFKQAKFETSQTGSKGGQSQITAYKSAVIAVGGSLLLVGLLVWQIPTAINLWQAKAAVPQPPPDEVEALAFIEKVTAPGDCLITDDMQLVYWSGRMVPPELAEVSSNRLKSGALTLAELIAISDQYDCQLVAAVSNRIPKYLPEYMDWVKTKYLGMFHYGEDDLFFAKKDTDPKPAIPLRANFDDQIIFHGYTLPEAPVQPGARVPLTLTWQAQVSPESDYAIFVQLRDSSKAIWASADHQPYKGLVPTSIWPEGAVIQEVTWLDLPMDIPQGTYNLYVGLYHPETLERVPLLEDQSGENALVLGPLEVQ